MSLRARLRHTVVIERSADGTQNDYGVPAKTWTTLKTVKGWLQPMTRKEKVQQSSGGALRFDGKLFMLPTDITEADRVVVEGTAYEIMDVHDAAGKDQHYEVMVKRSEVV